MVEVFKTNVEQVSCSEKICSAIQALDRCYEVNFDLEDCDRILRVENPKGPIDGVSVIHIVGEYGFKAEILCH